MANQSNISGNQNIVIQNVTESTISVFVNGEGLEIRNELAELKRLLQEQHAQSVQFAERIYDIAHFDEANFGFVTGKKAFNESLTRQLIESILPYSKAAQEFLKSTEGTPGWQSQERFYLKAHKIIYFGFVGVIGPQLRKLIAIGKEEFSENKQRDYIGKCIDIAKYSLDLLSITLLSKLWDEHRIQPRSFNETELKAFKTFFDNIIEPSLLERFHFLQILDGVFANKKNALTRPLSEWPDFSPALISDSGFHQACQNLANLNGRLEKKQYNLLDCFEAEKQLGTFFQNVSFLANYSMASIRDIGYREPRNSDARYLHRFTALGFDNKSKENAEKVNCTPETVHTDAVLLYHGSHYFEYINLSPFVIDYNSLTLEKGTKICFYTSKNFDSDILEYVFLEDNSIVNIEKKGILKDADLNEIMMHPEKQIILNLDNIVDLFEDARRCLLG
jgi:hypothetical protein